MTFFSSAAEIANTHPPPPITRVPAGQVAATVFGDTEFVDEVADRFCSPGIAAAGCAPTNTCAPISNARPATSVVHLRQGTC